MIPDFVRTALRRLNDAGFEAYCVGGCVRDTLLGVTPHDWDVATSAHPTQIERVFGDCRTIGTGLRHGTVTVLMHGLPLEITAYRADGDYSDHRHPIGVTFVSDLREDMARRDFTVNAMAMDGEGRIIDHFGGREDLARGVLRAVGEPERRFEEDALRILRGVRFSAQLGFELEHATRRAMEEKAPLLAFVSGERILTELERTILSGWAQKTLLSCADLLAAAVPEIREAIGFEQRNRHHVYDVWEHTVRALCYAPQDRLIRLALLFHDTGKPRSFTVDAKGEGHFYAHARLSAELAETALRRLRADRETLEEVVWLVRMHDLSVTPERRTALRLVSRYGFERTRRLLLIKEADNISQSPSYTARGAEARALLALVDEIEREKPCLTLKELAVKGDDLTALGMSGPAVGETLRRLLDDVLEERCANEREALLARVRR